MTVYATIDDIATRYPRELTVLAADEDTGERDDARVEAVLADVSVRIDSVLVARWRRDELARLDQPSLDLLRSCAIDMALYRVALSFSRSSERLQAGYDGAMRDLRAMTKGDGALTFTPDPSAQPVSVDPGETAISNTAVLIEGNERVFTRGRLRGM